MSAADLDPRLQGLSPAKRKLLFERLQAQAARRLEEGGGGAIAPAPRGGPLPLSFAQEEIWLSEQMAPGGSAFNIPAALSLEGALDAAALAAALAAVVARHEALRTRFEEEEGRPRQVVEPAAAVPLPWIDLDGLPEARQETSAIAEAEHRRPFDLWRGPLLRALLLRLAPRRHVLLLTLHHIAADGWSIGVLMNDLAAFYEAHALPALPIQYADYAWHQRRRLQGERLEALVGWWRERLLPEPPPLALPTDRRRPPVPSGRGGIEVLTLPAGLPRVQDATPFVVLLAAFQTLLVRLTGQDDLALGTPVAGRDRPEIEGLTGCFVNTLALRTDLGGDPTFAEALARVRRTATEAWAHAELPFELLVEELRPKRVPGVPPLFQALFALQNTPSPKLELPDLSLTPLDPTAGRAAKLDLSLSLIPEADRLTADAVYSRDLFDATSVRRLLRQYALLLEEAVADPGRRISDLSLLSAAERHQLAIEWNDTAVPASDLCVHELFRRRAEHDPGRPAVEDGEVTYGQLAAGAGDIARELLDMGIAGIAPESRVGVLLPNSVDALAAILGVLAAGAAYVPLDPESGEERLAWLLEDSGAAAVITMHRFADRLPAGLPRLLLDGRLPDDRPAPWPAVEVDPGQAAYVLYTSGSTGRPKGVVVSHRSLANYLAWVSTGLPRRPLPWISSPAFDASLKQTLAPLLRGDAVWIARWDSPAEELAGRPGAAFNGVPSLWRTVLDGSRAPALAAVLLGGEALSPDLAEQTLAALPGAEVWNLYGPTEATANASFGRVTAGSTGIGRPITNARLHVLDRWLGLLPIGASGELCIGGTGLARGYLGRPDLTAERFVPAPGVAGDRLYRTGDRARRLPDGSLEYQGRLDDQVKVRGVRVEPGEVEAALSEHPAVRACAVVAREDRLVAYVVGKDTEPGILREHLERKLPPYMVPSRYIQIPELPLTPTGKVDRRALPDPEPAVQPGAYEPPRTEMEARLAALWSEVLGVERVGVHDSFFELGGHSLLAVRLAARAREQGLALNMGQVFQAPTVARLAALVEPEPTAPPATEMSEAFPDAELSARDLESLLARLQGDRHV